MIWGNTKSRVTSGYVEFRNGRFKLVPLLSGPGGARPPNEFWCLLRQKWYKVHATVWVSLCFDRCC